jgi:hypothetical protein
MEEKRRGRQPPLTIERAFAGSRLEQQILIRVYELAAPILRKPTDAIPLPELSDRFVSDSFQSPRIARGA